MSINVLKKMLMNKNILSESWIDAFKKESNEIFWKFFLVETLENLKKPNGNQASFFSLRLHRKSVAFVGKEKGKTTIFEQFTKKELLEKLASIRTITECVGNVEFDVSLCPPGVYQGIDVTKSTATIEIEITKHIPMLLVGQTKVSQALYYAVMGTNPIKKNIADTIQKEIKKVLRKSWTDFIKNWESVKNAGDRKYWEPDYRLSQVLSVLHRDRWVWNSNPSLVSYTDREIEIGANHVKLAEIKEILRFNLNSRPQLEIVDEDQYWDKAYYIDQNGDLVFSGKDFELINGNIPISCVVFNDAAEFCNRLSVLLGLEPCYEEIPIEPNTDWKYEPIPNRNGYRLLSTLEFEYLAKAGTQNRWSGTDDERKLKDYVINLWTRYLDVTKLYSKQRKPNEWELYDMNGLFSEISNDRDAFARLLNTYATSEKAKGLMNTHHKRHRTDLQNIGLLTSFRIVRNA